MLKFTVDVIPHAKQRYDTAGDYLTDEERIDRFYISHLPDWRHEILVAVHEIIEFYLCKHRGISEEEITIFDVNNGSSDPGMLPDAPYHREHLFATAVEMMLADQLGIKWTEYEAEFCKLEYGKRDANPDT